MEQINTDIANRQFKKVYLLFGEEIYLKNQFREKLDNALSSEGDTMNRAVYDGDKISVGEVIDLAETMPFLAEYRLILINDSGLFKEGGEEMASYIPNIPESTVIVFTESSVDKRSRLYKAVKDKGRAVEFTPLGESDLKKWILGKIGREKLQIRDDALTHLLEVTGTDMSTIETELEKLICYVLGNGEIRRADIDNICSVHIQDRIFDMIDAISKGNQKTALSLYGDLLSLKVSPMKILSLIARQFNILLQIKELGKNGFSQGEMASKIGLPPFVVRKNMPQADRFSKEQIEGALNDCVSYEEAFKTGRIGDQLSVEILIVKFTGKAYN